MITKLTQINFVHESVLSPNIFFWVFKLDFTKTFCSMFLFLQLGTIV